jgi:hypothetical protein
MKRRQFIKASIGGGVTIVLIGGGAIWLNIDSNQDPLTIDAALTQLLTNDFKFR